jgi:hypothetical protein
VVRDELVAAHRERLALDLAHAFEEPLAPAENDRRDVQPHLVDQAGGQVLVDRRRAAGDRDLAAAGRRIST